MFNLSKLALRKGHKSSKRKVGRGYGSGHGGHTSTRGQKGQKSRSGGQIPSYFEGGQLRLVKRLPHVKGFVNTHKKKPNIIKSSQINNLKIKKISPEILVEKGLIRKISQDGVKILLDEPINISVNIENIKMSKAVRSSVEKAGGNIL